MRKEEVLSKIMSGDVLLGTVSGVGSTKPSLIRLFDEDISAIDVITTKSFQLTKNDGNREPVICEPEVGTFGNSVGLRNPGMDVALKDLKKLRADNCPKKILNISVSASSPEDFVKLIKGFEEYADIIELNFSCPHAACGYGASIGGDLNIATEYVKFIKNAIPKLEPLLFVKLTPNVDSIADIAKGVIEAGADGITAINTVGPELYTEQHSGKPILNNKLGGKGGKSGLAVFEKALEDITAIRKAVGNDVPIFGMGGVASGAQIAKLQKAGANIIGLGSVLGRVRQQNWAKFLDAIKSDAKLELQGTNSNKADVFISKEKQLKYEPRKITAIRHDSKDVITLTLEGEMPFSAGEFIFLWLPEIGEKPFSLALSNPATIVIKRRGFFTNAVFNLKVGDTVYVRGLYGKPVEPAKTKNALLLAGGTGIAVLPKLAEALHKNSTKVSTYIGTSESSIKEDGPVEKTLQSFGEYKCVADDGVIGRVIQELKTDIQHNSFGLSNCTLNNADDFSAYLVGPTVFMKIAAQMLKDVGVKSEQIFISLEMNTMCGIGVCGECVCGKKLTCQHGTFFNYAEYEKTEEGQN